MSRRRKNGVRQGVNKQRDCDPSKCDNCQYIGEGGFICDIKNVIVVESWTPTDNYLCCQKANK